MGKSLKRSISELVDETIDQIENLRADCELFELGVFTKYKGMSVILRTMLRGSSGQPPLLSLTLPNAKFFPLAVVPVRAPPGFLITPTEIELRNDAGGVLHLSAGSRLDYLGIEDGGIVLSRIGPVGGNVWSRMRLKSLFNLLGAPMDLDVWLSQSFLRPEWTIRDFIALVAHKDGGAHVDDSIDLNRLRGAGNIQAHLIHSLARCVASEIERQIRTVFPNHQRVVR